MDLNRKEIKLTQTYEKTLNITYDRNKNITTLGCQLSLIRLAKMKKKPYMSKHGNIKICHTKLVGI